LTYDSGIIILTIWLILIIIYHTIGATCKEVIAMDVCPACDGSGWVVPDNVDVRDPDSKDNEQCTRCKGEGVI